LTGRALPIALGISLTANLFLVGAIAGGLYMQAQKPPPQAQISPGRACGDAGAPRGAFRQMLCNQVQTVRPIQQDSAQAKRQALALLAAPTYDRAAVGALYDRARADDMKIRAQIENAVLDFAAHLSVNRRERLADGLRGNAKRRAMMMRQGAAAGG